MSTVRIVTDSTADLDPKVAEELGITVVPLNIHIGKEVLREGLDIDTHRLFKRLKHIKSLPTTSPPTAKAFEEAYGALLRDHDAILSIHLSARLSQTVAAAERGALPYLGRKKISVLDSMSTSRGLGYLAMTAAQGARDGLGLEELVRQMRNLIPHVYLVFFAEASDYLARSGRLRQSMAPLSATSSPKSLLAIEDGELVPLERVRTRQRAIEKLAEFTLEFSRVRRMTVLHSNGESEVRDLITRINDQLPKIKIETAVYGPSLATHVGPDAIGIVIFEDAP